jgi:hypothetical protein
MSWWRRKAEPPQIPPYQPPAPLPLFQAKPKDEGIEVEEVDMSATGIFRIFGRRPKGP